MPLHLAGEREGLVASAGRWLTENEGAECG